jgi:hypothetical protein
VSGAFNPWAALAKIRRERLGGLGADEAPAAAGEARFSARLAGLGGLGIRHPAASASDPVPVIERGPLPHGDYGDAEAAAMAQHYAAPPSARPYRPSDPDPLRDGLLAGALMRPPFWDGGAPPRGAWCSCCGRSNPQAGGRWWRPRHPRMDGTGTGPGWRCWTCHPPPPGCETEEIRT